jgi:hypothetical protein
MLTLDWVKSTTEDWLPLHAVDLSGVYVSGVYIIWHGGDPPGVIKIGHGNIAVQLNLQSADLGILMYGKKGTLYVTWAFVQEAQRNGVARYLASRYNPFIADDFQRVELIPVNLVA